MDKLINWSESTYVEQVLVWVEEIYGISGKLSTLPGEADYNFKLQAEDKLTYVLKLSRNLSNKAEFEFQAKILHHIASKELSFDSPEVVLTKEGALFSEIRFNEEITVFIRLQSWVEGALLAEINPRSTKLFKAWGKTCGQLSKSLVDFDHPFAYRFYKWDPSQTLYWKKQDIPFSHEIHEEIAAYFWDLIEHKALPKLKGLRKSINYNDAHESNLLVNKGVFENIIGVIDFGDALYTHLINEVAIASAYAGMGMEDPLRSICDLLSAYHLEHPLLEQELEVLYYMIAARLLITVSNSALAKIEEPENEYLQVSEEGAWGLLKKWRQINPSLAHYRFRSACAYSPYPSQEVEQFLQNYKTSLKPIISFNDSKLVTMDLSVGSLDLGGNSHFASISKFCHRIQCMLDDAGGEIGIGGYGEIRPFYTTDSFTSLGNNGPQWRTCHLGVDVWIEAGTPVYTPLDAKVYSIKDNKGECDYGPTIILEHLTDERLPFYTLYGHLAEECLNYLKEGQSILAGERIAFIGAPPSNGNWPSHLHFQLIKDLLGEVGDFPGVAFPHEKEIWMSICPNPSMFFPVFTSIENVPSLPDLLSRRHQMLGPNLSVSYDEPLYIQRGFGQYLYDQNGRRHLDLVNNVAHVGHENAYVVRAGQRQMEVLNTNTRYINDQITSYAQKLLATFPESLSVVYFVNSGSEANELALRLAKTYTHAKQIIALEVGYHGNTSTTIDVSSYKFDSKGGSGKPNNTHLMDMPDAFRGKIKGGVDLGYLYAKQVDELIATMKEERKVAAFIGESILSCGGQIVLPEGYLKYIYQAVRKAGGVCIADEVQTGFARVGEAFWAFETQGVLPDIVTLGKPMGNGHPIGAVVTTKVIGGAFDNGMEYFNTYGGNPVSCAIGAAVLDQIEKNGLREKALDLGKYFQSRLVDLQAEFPIIGDVRGIGLFLGFELVKSRESLSPAVEQAHYLVNRMRTLGILMSVDGPLYNVIKIKPPLCITKENVDFVITTLSQVLKEDAMQV